MKVCCKDKHKSTKVFQLYAAIKTRTQNYYNNEVNVYEPHIHK